MLSTIFYLIVIPTILAFLLGFAAHGLKTMVSDTGDGTDGGGNGDKNLDQDTGQPTQQAPETGVV